MPLPQMMVFLGAYDILHVTEFLSEIREMKISHNITDEALYREAAELFYGPGLEWFQQIRHFVESWTDIVEKMKLEFLPLDYEDRLWNIINKRIQGDREPVTIYILRMQNLFLRFEKPPSLANQLDVVIKNLQPYLTQKLGFISWWKLRKLELDYNECILCPALRIQSILVRQLISYRYSQ